MIPSKEKIEEMVKELQKIMRIQDWDIDIKLLTGKGMEKETGDSDTWGNAYRNIRCKYAIIAMNTEDEEGIKEWYHTLIHEMKHIQTTELINNIDTMIKNLHVDEDITKVFMSQIENQYELWMNNCAREFIKIYPVTNFMKEGESNG